MTIELFVQLGLIAAATLISEDLACISTGLLIAQGKLGFVPGSAACLIGIFAGDMMLFLAGRLLGRAALGRAPLKWLLDPAAIDSASEWLSRRGLAVIMTTRFIPGTRLPAYFAAGMLKTRTARFSILFFLAASLWTPLLVGLATVLGRKAVPHAQMPAWASALLLGVSTLTLFLLVRKVPTLLTYRGRRFLVSSWRRLTRWEFWPVWVFYLPIVLYTIVLAIRYRSLTVFTHANPGIPLGGFVGESKSDILNALSNSDGSIARYVLLGSRSSSSARLRQAESFLAAGGAGFPVVLKPDRGQRGAGVLVLRSRQELERAIVKSQADMILQEYVDGLEFGVFYCRYPSEASGKIFSITEKRFPSVVGDGKSTLERLVLEDQRAVCMARVYLRSLGTRARTVPQIGERIRLTELGSHCRGALFLDGRKHWTPELEESIDRIARRFEGFYFGRFDIRAPSLEAFTRGTGFKVIELNGVTSEATHIYDPAGRLLDAYRVMFRQWRLAFDIGKACCAASTPAAGKKRWLMGLLAREIPGSRP